MRMPLCYLIWCVACYSAHSQQARELVNGSSVQVVGKVGLVQFGNKHYLVLRPNRPYRAVFDSTDTREVREINFTLYGQWDALKSLPGQTVSVSGKVQLEPTSPYYLNGTLIVADTIQLTNGVALRPKTQPATGLPAQVTKIFTLVTFTPRAWDQLI